MSCKEVAASEWTLLTAGGQTTCWFEGGLNGLIFDFEKRMKIGCQTSPTHSTLLNQKETVTGG